MDAHEHEGHPTPVVPSPTAPRIRLRPASRRCRATLRSRSWLGSGAALVLAGSAVAVHAGTAASASTTAVLSRPVWSSGSSAAPYRTASGGAPAPSTATAAQERGVVDIDVVLGATGQQAAGTGMVLTSNGEVLTNRHVVNGETSMTVTVPATGRTYAAHVVGVAADTDVAVVQLENASGLATVTPASEHVSVGDAVVGVGNAGGEGGTPSAAPGQITGVDQSITATDGDGGDPEWLTGLLETDAAIEPGDSGGPLYDTSNQVVGMDTAGSSQGGPDAYAIPIDTALTAARQIESGAGADQSTGQGTGQAQPDQSAHLGVEVEDGPDGVHVAGVVHGSPASAAGLTAGDTLTSVAGRRVPSVADLGSVLSSLSPGQRVGVTWVDQDGQVESSAATLA